MLRVVVYKGHKVTMKAEREVNMPAASFCDRRLSQGLRWSPSGADLAPLTSHQVLDRRSSSHRFRPRFNLPAIRRLFNLLSVAHTPNPKPMATGWLVLDF